MWEPVLERFSSWKEIVWSKLLVICAALWFALGAWDLVKSELLPEKYQSWTVVAHTPHFQWRTWALVLSGIFIAILLEGTHAAIQNRDKAIASLRADITKSAAVFSQTTLKRDWPGDWKLAEDGFRRYQKSFVSAAWFHDSSGPTETWSLRGATEDARDVKALCMHAGKLLTVSPMRKFVSAEVLREKDDADRWLYFLKGLYGITEMLHGTSVDNDGNKTVAYGGSIQNLPGASARACVECAARSFDSEALG
jgi:hypothetical protein